MKLTSIRHPSISNPKSNSSPVSAPLPSRVVLHLGSPWGEASPLVKKGDEVKTGQCVARGDNPLVPPVNASVSGTVTEIRRWVSYLGDESPAVVIQSDGKDEAALTEQIGAGVESDPRKVFQRIHDAGIREVDPYAWPLPFRIGSPALIAELIASPADSLTRPIETLIINAVDRQPGVFVRRTILSNHEADLLEAIPLLKAVSSAARTVLALPQEQILSSEFQQNVSSLGVQLVRCPNKYPLALEPLLVQFVTNKEVPQPANDPRMVGAAVVDVASAVQVREAILGRTLPAETVVEAETPGHGVSETVRVRRGTIMEDLLEYLPRLPEKPAKVITGGLFLGQAQYSLQVPVGSEVDSIIFQGEGDLIRTQDEPCLNCGNCVKYCPMQLLPNELGKFCEYGRFEDAEKKFLFNCIECGLCAYVCPARRPMVQLLRFGKQQLSAMREAS